MKSVMIMLCATLVCGTQVHALGKKQPQPATAKADLAKRYPQATHIKWDSEGNDFEASFDADNKHTSLLYDASGRLKETETEIDISELPVKARTYASGRGRIKEAARIVKADGATIYEAEVRKEDLLFDSNGNFMSSRKKNGEDSK